MATLKNYITLQDGMSPALNSIANATQKAAGKLDSLSTATQKAAGAAGAAGGAFNRLKGVFSGALGIGAALTAVALLRGSFSDLVSTAERYASISARMTLVAGSLERANMLNEMIYESAQRARGGYLDMADSVARLATSAQEAFPDPRKAVDFMEGVQKLFVVGGADAGAQKNAMLQLTQALASGRLQGDEFRSISENAPVIQDIIAKHLNITKGQLKELSTAGELTASVIKDAILSNMDEINEKFDRMPKTWANHFTDLSNHIVHEFRPVYVAINALANSESVRKMVANIKGAITAVAPIVYWIVNNTIWATSVIMDAFSAVAEYIREHMTAVKTVLYGAAAALAVLSLEVVAAAGHFLVFAGHAALAAVTVAAKAVADWMATGAILAMTLAQDGLNAALYACPLTWVVGLLLAIIGIVYGVVAAINFFAGTSISATGVIFGAFAWVFAGIFNQLVFAWNMFAAFANFLGAVFVDPVGAIYNIFADIWNAIVGLVAESVNIIIGLINKIPGVHIEGRAESLTLDRKEISGAMWNVGTMDYANKGAWAAAGYQMGQGLEDSIAGAFALPDMNGFAWGDTDEIDPITKNTAEGARQGKRAADALEATNEDLKFLREAAERRYINNYTRNISVDVGGLHAGGSGARDFDGMVRQLTEKIVEAVETGSEGALA